MHLGKLSLVAISLLLITAGAGIVAGWWLLRSSHLVDGHAQTTRLWQNPQVMGIQSTQDQMILGYLPYWEAKPGYQLPTELTDLAIFAVSIDPGGSIKTRDANGDTAPDWRNFNSNRFDDVVNQAIARNLPLTLALTQFDDAELADFLASAQAQQTFFENLNALITRYPFTGLHLDFEPPSGGQSLRNEFTEFVRQLDVVRDTNYPYLSLSFAAYGSAARREQIWNLAALEPFIDYAVMMAYDYHRRSSSWGGPVAPLGGAGTQWDHDITTDLAGWLEVLSPQKVVLGVPWYGYGWRVYSLDDWRTYQGSGWTVRNRQLNEFITNPEVTVVERGFNQLSQSPYVVYTSQGRTYLIQHENQASLEAKYDLAEQLNLKGVAIWALGYE